MPSTINPIRKAKLKQSLTQGVSIRQSLKNAGYADTTAHGECDKDYPIVKQCISEILSEAEKRGIVNKAWKVVSKALDDPKKQISIAPAFALKDMTEKSEVAVSDSSLPALKDAEIYDKMKDLIAKRQGVNIEQKVSKE